MPVRSWEEFCGRYNELEGEGKTKLPPVPPTPIAPVFSEEEYFPQEDWGEVSVIVNARYCPAFCMSWSLSKLFMYSRGSCFLY